ncbi:multivesicular body subunit 12A isoform X1 [Tribolium castaneum]
MENPLTKGEEKKFGYPKVRDSDVKNEKPKVEVRRLQYDPNPKVGDWKKTCSPSCCPSLSGEERLRYVQRLTTMLKSSAENKILKLLPNDKPITAIQVIENLDKCPKGFHPISRTYDQDQDADLRESSIFKSSAARYLCVSKSEGLPNFVIQELFVLTEKFNPPRGFSLLNRTADSEQKAWKKKQLCYKLVNLRDTKVAVTDIIVCSRLKKAPEGFKLAGELNGVTVCFKMGNVQDTQNSPDSNGRNITPPVRPAPPYPGNGPIYPSIGADGGDHDYEILKPPGYPSGPSRPAPRPPAPNPRQNSTTGTLGASGGNNLDGVPFIVNPKFLNASTADRFQFPTIRAKTMQQILKEYDYAFTVERQT